MLYLVSESCTNENCELDNFYDFIVKAKDEKDLAQAIATNRLAVDGTKIDDIDGCTYFVRELGEEFQFEVNFEYVYSGKRLQHGTRVGHKSYPYFF